MRHRQSQRRHALALTEVQKYLQRELRTLFAQTEDEILRPQINVLERAFCTRSLPVAAKREINALRKNGANGEQLIKPLTELYYRFRLQDLPADEKTRDANDDIPRIVCSEALL